MTFGPAGSHGSRRAHRSSRAQGSLRAERALNDVDTDSLEVYEAGRDVERCAGYPGPHGVARVYRAPVPRLYRDGTVVLPVGTHGVASPGITGGHGS